VEVRQYRTVDGRTPIAEWLASLGDVPTRMRVVARLDRLGVGLFGDWRRIGSGVYELRIDAGPGYRVYYAQHGAAIILLLCGGDKGTQRRDIERAHAYWKDYKARS
jgi:putative addiction module killer protein